ncbi:LolA family protein [Pseudonocardia alaniniphila]|uniref:Outer membrane lipoprotein carrier protein LolA n=1 Tax=Pseudonocardia alaniniphila TaxID=75291 RepID=A0ABS9THY9_9PSEU|nr:outer membrane lipoprotein carrier protein LolA [Pseudonocardia alaniniphila]MCH6168166.1 outer membrane lipoprotein carrier protein LolA [Pseudonocardia alaniniphila]
MSDRSRTGRRGGGHARTTGRVAGAVVAVAGAVGLALLALPAGAGAAPELPPVTPEELVSSVLKARPGPFDGTVTLDNQLGLPALPNMPAASSGTSTVRVWSDGDGRGRVQVPSDSGERTLVSDGSTLWSWNSADRTVVRSTEHAERHTSGPDTTTDPTAAATMALAALRPSSTIDVDGTAEVAGRPAYELVLAPLPSERTLLREVRIAVDSATRVPLRLTVLANGSSDPALQLGFTDVSFGAQDGSLFTFTPPPGATVEDREPRAEHEKANGTRPTVVGDGWDSVIVTKAPARDSARAEDRRPGAPDLSTLGTPVSGPWGNGRLITTTVGGAIITDDGRVAAGAVPEQVLSSALSA